SLWLRRDIDGDRRERTEGHADDLKTDEVADAFHEPRAFEFAAIHADETEFFRQPFYDRFRLCVVGTQKDRDAPPRQFVMVEFDDLRSHCVESLDYTRPRRVGGEPFSERGDRRREVETGTIVRVGGIKPQYGAVVAVDDDLAGERPRFFEHARRKVIANGVEDHFAKRGGGVKVAGLRRAGAIGRNGFGLGQVSRAEEYFVSPARPA